MRVYAEAIGELHIVSMGRREAKEEPEGNLHLYPLHTWRLFRTAALTRRAPRIVRENGIEVVSAQDPFEHGLAALRAVRGTKAKLHIQVHTDFLSPWFVRSGNWRSPQVRMPLLNRLRRQWADRVLPKASGIRVVSKRIQDSLKERYGSHIVAPVVIPVAVNSSMPTPVHLPAHPFTFALISVSRLEPEKRVEDILTALAIVTKHYPMVGLFVVGEGRERVKLERYTRTLSLTHKVVFLGHRTDARALLPSAQAYIQASAYEGYGLTLVEAALARVPIITTDVGIVGEVFRGYEDVLSVPVADPIALSFAIIGLIEDTAVRQELPRRAEDAVRAHLATQTGAERIKNDLQQAILKK